MTVKINSSKNTHAQQRRFNPQRKELARFFRSYMPHVTKIDPGDDRIDPLLEIELFVQTCIGTDYSGYLHHPDSPPRFRYRPTKLTERHYSRINDWLLAYSLSRFYSPCIELFFNACIALRIAQEPLQSSHSLSSDGIPHAARFNALIECIRLEGRSKRFQDRLYESRSRAKSQFIQWADHIDHLFDEVRSRITVIRMDFAYRSEIAPLIEPEQADADFKRFLTNMNGKTSLFADLLSYFWKIEQSRSGCYHFHLLFLFKSDRLRNDAYRAEQIGEYWSKDVTEGRGTFFNAHRSTAKDKHTRLAIGRIEYHEDEKRKNLLNILAYFCKADQALRVKVCRRARSYGSSCLPQTDASRGGRPRRQRSSVLFDRVTT